MPQRPGNASNTRFSTPVSQQQSNSKPDRRKCGHTHYVVLNSQPSRLVKLPRPGDHLPSRSRGRSLGFQQRSPSVSLPVLCSVALLNVHGRKCCNDSRRGVYEWLSLDCVLSFAIQRCCHSDLRNTTQKFSATPFFFTAGEFGSAPNT